MKTTETITLIGIFATLTVSFINIILIRNKARVDGITNNRMIWINNVRDVISDVLTFDPIMVVYKPECKIDLDNAFRKNINTLKLYLNFQGELDKKIISECNILLDLLPQITILSTDGVVDAKPQLQFLDAQDKILMLSQIYLKSEWSRVKYENRIVKWPGKYWSLFKGFKETKLVNDLTIAFNHEVAHDNRRRTELNFFGIRRD